MSPLLANIAFDGMAQLFDGEDTPGNPKRPSWKTGRNKGISLIRSADAIVAIAPSREGLEQYVLPTLEAFLKGRGRQRSEAKTRMVQSPEGFHFLGFERKRYQRARLTQPQKAKVYGHYRTSKAYLKQHRQSPAAQIIRGLNPHMRGWANSYRHGAAKRALRNMDHLVWHALWQVGETPSSKAARAVGAPTGLPHRWPSSRGLCRRESPHPVVSRHAHYQDAKGQRESITDEPRPEDILGTTGTMATEDSHHRQAKKEPTPSSRLSLWSVQNALLRRRSYRRSPHQTQTARVGKIARKTACLCISGVTMHTTSDMDTKPQGLEPCEGRLSCTVLRGWGMVTYPGYPALSGAAEAQRSASIHMARRSSA